MRLRARLLSTIGTAALVFGCSLVAPTLAIQQAPQEKEKDKDKEKEKPKPALPDETPAVSKHEIKLGDRVLKYTATAGAIPLKDRSGELEARIFYVAYTLDGVDDAARRPLMFSFNGGPGSSSVWLHLGALGPKRVAFPDEPIIPAPPFKLVENEATWLDATDLVFIDPVGTGYSRAAKPELNKKFHGLSGDIASVGEFIRLYLTRNDRWASPLYLVGESYGTTRAAGLAGRLIEEGIAFNGVVLISSALSYAAFDYGAGNDLPYITFLPSFAATAWYHKKLPNELQSRELRDVVREVEGFAVGDYASALAAGERMSPERRAEIARLLARYTALPANRIDAANLRIDMSWFTKELLRDRDRTVGRLDSRFSGVDSRPNAASPGFDPSMAAIRAPYTAMLYHHLRTNLGYKTDLPYHILGSEEIGRWDFGPSGSGYPDTSRALRDALNRNPHMKVLFCQGYYDLATPYMAAEQTVAQLGLNKETRKNVLFSLYEAGHMMYLHAPSLLKLKTDAAAFIDGSRGK